MAKPELPAGVRVIEKEKTAQRAAENVEKATSDPLAGVRQGADRETGEGS